jgi:hypothetical protein
MQKNNISYPFSSQVGRDASETGINFGQGGIRGGKGLRGSVGTGGGAGLTEDGDKPLVNGPRDTVDRAVALHGNGSFDANEIELPPGAGGKYLSLGLTIFDKYSVK